MSIDLLIPLQKKQQTNKTKEKKTKKKQKTKTTIIFIMDNVFHKSKKKTG